MDPTLTQLFERQAAATPRVVAVVFEGQQLTYEELGGRANQVARFLIDRGVSRGVPVGILLDRSIEMVVAIWGLLKAGGAYVPLDTALPEARIAQIADETEMPLLLTDRSLADRLPAHVPAVLWEDVEPDIVRQPTAAVAAGDVGAEDVAYIAFTSGSTGRPKGVLIPHRVFTRCRRWALDVFGFTPRDRFLLNFFRAPEELFYPHLIGATLILSPPGAERDMRLLADVVAEHRIHVLGLTPSLLSAFLDEYPTSGEDSLRHVFCAGEALPIDFQRRFFRKSGAHLYNFYGLSEAPYTLIWRCLPEDTRPVLPIGRPVDAKVLVLDEQRRPVRGEAVGELFIGGPGLAVGYLNQPELTARKFVDHEGERLYCTGDLVHYDAEGAIVYLGRSDHQVQIRGLRVELGEIEAALRQLVGIREAVVELREGQLVSYVTLEPDAAIDACAWREGIQLALPEFMRPSAYVVLTDFPRSPTGKTDRKALPDPRPQAVTDLRKPALSTADRHRLLVAWNDTDAAYPAQCVHDLFEEQARRTPDAVAVTFEGEALTYRQLDQRANRLARELAAKGVGANALVAICVERSLELIVGLLGILKAGGAYVPLDAGYPEERLAFVLDDCGAPLLVTSARIARHYGWYEGDLLILELVDDSADDPPLEAGAPQTGAPSAAVTPEDLACVVYTSGSTGRPKGVEVVHRGIVRLVVNSDYCRFDSSRVFLQFAPVTFDGASFEIWGALLHGARLVVAPPGRDAMERIPALIAEQRITTAWLSAGLFNQIVDRDAGVLGGLEELLIGGEALSPAHVARAIRALPQTQLVNGYGPTEATTFTATYRITQRDVGAAVPIGRPIANTRVYILDEAMQLVPVGATGELYISGPGLARGYLNRPDLTSARFRELRVEHRAERVYRTGDLCRWRVDGNLEFVGRVDEQVKIRGFRVEPGEVEAVLGALPGVTSCAVLAVDVGPGDKQLAAYVSLEGESPPSRATLKSALSKELPDYMVPGVFFVVDELPLNANGKLDRRALGERGGRVLGEDGEAAPAQTELERQLLEIWRELLPVEQVGTQDSFFDLGGHSLLAAKLVQRIEDLLGRKVPVTTLFHSPSVAQMALRLMDEDWAPPWSSLVPLQPHGSKPPLFFVHGWGGTVFGFVELAQLLPADQPCYGVQALGLDGVKERDLSVEAMAANYVEEIASFQPTGPVHVVGYSIGGMIAYEVAQQLRRRGRDVATLALVDSTPFGWMPWRFRAVMRAFELAGRCRSYVESLWSRVTGESRRDVVGGWRQKQGAGGQRGGVAASAAAGSESPCEGPTTVDYYVAIATTYSPQPYPGSADLFISQYANRGLRYFWRATIRGGVRFHTVRGEHLEIIQSPERRAELAESITRVLDRTHS